MPAATTSTRSGVVAPDAIGLNGTSAPDTCSSMHLAARRAPALFTHKALCMFASQEINFVLSDLALEVVGDAAIVWLLSPKAAIAPRAAGGLSRFTTSLPGYFLQVIAA